MCMLFTIYKIKVYIVYRYIKTINIAKTKPPISDSKLQ